MLRICQANEIQSSLRPYSIGARGQQTVNAVSDIHSCGVQVQPRQNM